MKQLTCEMCGSTDLIKQDGLFVCQTCGTKYSVEEAKKMMIEGIVQVDNTPLIDNYLTMAKNAYASHNLEETESYCNKIIEIDSSNYEAWLFKGKAAGWSSTLKNQRLKETISAFAQALNNCPAELKDELIEDCKTQIIDLTSALIRKRGEIFEKLANDDTTNEFLNDIEAINSTIVDFLNKTNISISKDLLMRDIASIITDSINTAYHNVFLAYLGDDGHPNDYEFRLFLGRATNCSFLLKRAIDLCESDDDADIYRYDLLVAIETGIMNSGSYEWDYRDWTGRDVYRESLSLTNDAIRIHQNKIYEYQAKSNKLKAAKEQKIAKEKAEKEKAEKAAAQKRFNEYWEAHSEEKTKLENECEEFKQQIAELRKTIQSIPGEDEKRVIQQRINQLETQKKTLGLFKIREKKEIQEKIDEESSKIATINNKMSQSKKDIESKIAAVQKKLDRKTQELTKPR